MDEKSIIEAVGDRETGQGEGTSVDPSKALMPGQWLYALSSEEELAPSGRPGIAYNLVRPLKPGEREELDRAIRSVTNIVQGFMVYIRQALNDLGESIQRVFSEHASMSGDVNSRRIELEYRMLNVCAAIRMYEEHTYSEIDRKYGPNSSQRIAAKVVFTQTYDKSLEYRILYYLRNAMTHGSRNLISFAFSATSNPGEDPSFTLQLPLQRDKFFASNAKATVRQEVQAMSEDPDTLSMCFSVLATMTDLNHQLTPILEPDLLDHVVTLAHLINEAAAVRGYPAYGSLAVPLVTTPDVDDKVDITLSILPLPEPVRDFVVAVVNSDKR
ncbi:hypothetical protein [Arthrobacter sp. FW306-2-2C-D06B]|uniref:hypothetical protein n=1 Tax=Arthrobacter sp. FW306-2-2C-D06B TaxID=2879618 RepID=UPI001F21BC0A|nr:hypothetical protein [Arthrobacter sp. FW306-2-2C-D06B]UKA59135.1 hypothetical protein LFT47_01915 [Arthrobacter sp. FW306-2-2C-D06B]